MTNDVLDCALGHARRYLAGLEDGPVGSTLGLKGLRESLDKPLGDEGLPALEVIDQLVRDASPGLVASAGGRFFGWVIGGAVPAAVAADWLTSVWDQNAALYACSPAAATVEEVAGAWLKDLLGLPAQASFAFVTGCQMAHVTCLAAARHALLKKRGWSVEEDGLAGAPAIRILTSEHGHGSIARAATLLGLGRKNIVKLAIDPLGRIALPALANALDEAQPTILVLQAGDIAT